MNPFELDELSPEQQAVIEYLFKIVEIPGQRSDPGWPAEWGLLNFLWYLSETVATRTPGALSFLPGRSIKDALRIHRTEDILLAHVFESLMQKILLDEEHKPETHPYTKPLHWPPAQEGEDRSYMSRFDLYAHVSDFLSRGIDATDFKVKRTLRTSVRNKLQHAIHRHYAKISGSEAKEL